MIRSRSMANRYLAGLVIAFAVLHVATVILATALLWSRRNHAELAVDLLLLGIVPGIIAALLGLWGWTARNGRSASWSAGGLAVLLAAMAVSHHGAGIF